jgi:hypothetical protein
MYRARRLEFRKDSLLVNALIMRARFNRMYYIPNKKLTTGLKDDLQD